MRLCVDMGIEPTDVRLLVLAWQLRAAEQGYFTRGIAYRMCSLGIAYQNTFYIRTHSNIMVQVRVQKNLPLTLNTFCTTKN